MSEVLVAYTSDAGAVILKSCTPRSVLFLPGLCTWSVRAMCVQVYEILLFQVEEASQAQLSIGLRDDIVAKSTCTV